MNNSIGKNGYIIVSSEEIRLIKKKLRTSIIKASNHILKLNTKKSKKFSNFDNVIKYMYGIDIKQKTNLISKLYDITPDLHEVHEITASKTFVKIIKKLGIKYPTVGTNITLRLDRPYDRKLNTSLHQDIWYSMISNNSLTIWFNLSKVNEIDGPLEICKTFKKKIYKFTDNKMGTYTAEVSDKYKFNQIYLKENEILVFSQYLLHRSGNNLSNKPRASIQIRYNDFYNNKKFNKSYKSMLSSHVLNNQKKYLI